MKFIKHFDGVPVGHIYPLTFKPGDECPPELEDVARDSQALETEEEAGMRRDGPTVLEHLEAGHALENYPPDGFAPRSTAAEIAFVGTLLAAALQPEQPMAAVTGSPVPPAASAPPQPPEQPGSPAVAAADLEKHTVPELREMLAGREITAPSDAKKAELIALLLKKD